MRCRRLLTLAELPEGVISKWQPSVPFQGQIGHPIAQPFTSRSLGVTPTSASVVGIGRVATST